MSKYKIKRNQKEVAKLPTVKRDNHENPFVKKISFFKHMNNNEGLIEFKSSYKGKHFEITDFSNAEIIMFKDNERYAIEVMKDNILYTFPAFENYFEARVYGLGQNRVEVIGMKGSDREFFVPFPDRVPNQSDTMFEHRSDRVVLH